MSVASNEPSGASRAVAWGEVLTRDHAAPLALVCLGVWLHAADGLIVATMMPHIVTDIGGAAYVAWTIALYELGSIVAGASGALLVLRLGIRRPMALAAVVFALGCLISAAAPAMPVLLIGRLLQGLGGGGLTALSFVTMNLVFETRLTARVMALISVLWGASAFLGPLIGGIFVEYASWRLGFMFFAMQAAGLAIWIVLGSRIDEKTAPEQPQQAPILRLLILALGVLLVAAAGINVSFPRTPAFLAAGLGVLLFFLRQDGRNPASRLLPRQPFNLRSPVGAALTMNLTMSVATIGLAAYGPLLMSVIHHIPAMVTGYVLACEAIAWTLAAILLSGAPESRDRAHVFCGMVLVACGVASLIYALPNGPVGLIALAAAAQGGGFGMAWTFVLRRTRRLVEPDDLERLSGAMSTTGHFGYALGAALTGIIANAAGFSVTNSVDQASTVARMIFGGCALAALFGLVATLCFVRPFKAATGA